MPKPGLRLALGVTMGSRVRSSFARIQKAIRASAEPGCIDYIVIIIVIVVVILIVLSIFLLIMIAIAGP